MAKRIVIGTIAGILVLGALGLYLGESSDANEEAATFYVIAIGVATLAAIVYLAWVAVRSRRRGRGRRPVRNDATRT